MRLRYPKTIRQRPLLLLSPLAETGSDEYEVEFRAWGDDFNGPATRNRKRLGGDSEAFAADEARDGLRIALGGHVGEATFEDRDGRALAMSGKQEPLFGGESAADGQPEQRGERQPAEERRIVHL